MELWFEDLQKPGLKLNCKILRVLHRVISPYQEIVILETEPFGKVLILDGAIQTTVFDEFIYHEMLVHVSLNSHPAPEEVLIIGGGDGGSLREVLRHPEIKKVTLVEIDKQVVDVCQRYLPELACSFNDRRLELHFEDGVSFVQDKKECYDVILIDSTDPVGSAVGLFSPDFYSAIYQALRAEGLMTAQTETPFYDSQLINRVYESISNLFPITKVLVAPIPSYPGGYWSATLGSKNMTRRRRPAISADASPLKCYATITRKFMKPASNCLLLSEPFSHRFPYSKRRVRSPVIHLENVLVAGSLLIRIY